MQLLLHMQWHVWPWHFGRRAREAMSIGCLGMRAKGVGPRALVVVAQYRRREGLAGCRPYHGLVPKPTEHLGTECARPLACCSSFFVSNIFAGILWYVLPAFLIVANDICAYLAGRTDGRASEGCLGCLRSAVQLG